MGVDDAERACRTWLAAYADAVDTADLGALARLCADVTVRAPSGEEGRGDEVAALYAPMVVTPAVGGARRSKHHVTNLAVALVSENEAVAQSYYLKLEYDGTRPALTGTGRYTTRLHRTADRWSVTRHQVNRDMP